MQEAGKPKKGECYARSGYATQEAGTRERGNAGTRERGNAGKRQRGNATQEAGKLAYCRSFSINAEEKINVNKKPTERVKRKSYKEPKDKGDK